MHKTIHIILCLLLPAVLLAQQGKPVKPEVNFPAYYQHTGPLQEMAPPPHGKYMLAKEIWNLKPPALPAADNPLPFLTDALLQSDDGTGEPARLLIKEHILDNPAYSVPPDANGDAGPDHYLHSVNVSFVVLDKAGKTLLGPMPVMSLWQNFPLINTTHGDPITIYDHLADRWLMSIMASINGGPVYYELIAVSETGDPAGSWHAYAYELDGLPDYPKFGLWHNGYYWTGNIYNMVTSEWHGAAAFAVDRDAMLAGSPDAMMLRFQTIPSPDFLSGPFSFLPSNLTGEAVSDSAPNYFMYVKDDAWGFPYDFLSIWECVVDWDDTAACSFAEVAQLQTGSFDANFNNFTYITQPNANYNLQSLSNRLMNRLDFRHYEGYDAMVTNHTVDCDGNDHAGLRWYELRNEGSGWSIHQEGTYAPDSDHRWMGSISQDAAGNIALGYSVSGDSTYPSVRATGRRAGDPPGLMTVPEFSIMEGGGSQTNSGSRWGDYTCMSLDPVDEHTFWYVNQYYSSDNTFAWKTALGGFYLLNDSAMHTMVSPDTLFFTSAQHMSAGRPLHVINPNTFNASVSYNDPYGEFYGTGAHWYVNSLATAPYFINAADTHTFSIRCMVNDLPLSGQYLMDTMLIVTSLDTHRVVISIADSLLVRGRDLYRDMPADMLVFPNPVKGQIITIAFNNPITEQLSITLSNMNGQLVAKQQYTMVANSTDHARFQIPQSLPGGIYLINIKTRHISHTSKILLLH